MMTHRTVTLLCTILLLSACGPSDDKAPPLGERRVVRKEGGRVRVGAEPEEDEVEHGWVAQALAEQRLVGRRGALEVGPVRRHSVHALRRDAGGAQERGRRAAPARGGRGPRCLFAAASRAGGLFE